MELKDINQNKSKSAKLSKSNKKSKSFRNFFTQIFSKKDENPDTRSSKDYHGENDDFQLSIPNKPKRKMKRLAPQPPQEPMINEPSVSQQNYAKNLNDIEKGISELSLSDRNSNSKRVDLAQVHIESDLTNSKGRKIKTNHGQGSKTKNGANAVPKAKRIFNNIGNQNKIENSQVQRSAVNEDMKTTKSENSNLTKAQNDQAVLNFQTGSKNDKPTFEIKSPNDDNNSSQIFENGTHQMETTKCNIRNEDETNKSNENESALENIESVMQEVENFRLEIQTLNNPESFFAIEMGLTNAIIKLDGIQMPKNELLKKKRKEGIILIHELFKQLDEHGKENQT